MSYDLRISFPDLAFPHGAWRVMLESFGWQDPDPAEAHASRDEWCLMPDEGHTLWLTLSPCDPREPGLCAPEGTRWRVIASTNAGRSAATWRTQFALAYHALALFPGASVHDCQHHLSVSTEDSTFDSEARWLQYAADVHRLHDLAEFKLDA